MTEHPITMSAESIRAIQAGLKHETRRPIKPQPEMRDDGLFALRNRKGLLVAFGVPSSLPLVLGMHTPYQPGDRLRVRESWATDRRYDDLKPRALHSGVPIFYLANGPKPDWAGRTRSARFMLKEFSRFILPLTIVREGVEILPWYHGDAIGAYERWWDSIYSETFPWASNPWPWVLGWEQVEGRE
jgi:hypothetical protein